MYNLPKKYVDIYSSLNKIVLRDDKTGSAVVISNKGNTIKACDFNNLHLDTTLKGVRETTMIHSIYGIVEFEQQKYLVVVKSVKLAANIIDKHIYQANEFDFIPLGYTADETSTQDGKYIDMFQNFFKREAFYYSPEYDLTSTFEKQAKIGFKNLAANADSRFFYNEVYVKDFLGEGLQGWIQPFMCGLVAHKYINIKNKAVGFALISRRDKNRAGMRFMSRGADLNGNVTNFAETEQILTIKEGDDTKVYSFLQIRGSIPLIWKQTPTLKYTPKVLIEANINKVRKAFTTHFGKLKAIYRKVGIVNLIDKKGSQYQLGKLFTELFNGLEDDGKLKYVWFDFHHECRKMQWHNLSKLIDQISNELNDHKYTKCIAKSGSEGGQTFSVSTSQEGVIRNNCMDCLDRTNVVQSVIARNVLLNQLHESGLSPRPNGNPFEELPGPLEETFRDIWTRNADRMSVLYSGTGALKTDFTRTGKRSFAGKLEDGKRSVNRYFLGNFEDTYNQNSLDFLLGKVGWNQIANNSGVEGKGILLKFLALVFLPVLVGTWVNGVMNKNMSWLFFLAFQGISIYMAISFTQYIGYSKIRLGYAGQAQPRLSSPSYFASHIAQLPALDPSLDPKNPQEIPQTSSYLGSNPTLFGDELIIDNPNYRYKRIFNVDDGSTQHLGILADFYTNDLCPRLSIDPKQHPIIFSESNQTDKDFRKAISGLIQKAGVPKFFLVKKAALNLYTCGRSNGLVLESGGAKTTVTPIEDGYVHQRCSAVSLCGGDNLSKAIEETLSTKKILPQGLTLKAKEERYDTTFFEYFRLIKAEEIKKKLIDLQAPLGEGKVEDMDVEGGMKEEFALPDGTIFQMTEELNTYSQTLFLPTRSPTGSKRIIDLLQDCYKNLKENKHNIGIMNELLVLGGNSKLKGFGVRVKQSADKFSSIKTDIAIRMKALGEESDFSSWLGGSILGSISSFEPFFISKSEIDEHGENVFYRKCP